MKWSEIVGKTIKFANYKTTDDVVHIGFTDGTEVILAIKPIVHGLYTPILIPKVSSI